MKEIYDGNVEVTLLDTFYPVKLWRKTGTGKKCKNKFLCSLNHFQVMKQSNFPTSLRSIVNETIRSILKIMTNILFSFQI